MCGLDTPLPSFENVGEADVAVIASAFEWFFTEASKRELDSAQAVADARAFGVGEAEADAMGEALAARRGELERASVRHASAMSTAVLDAFDWKVHTTVSSDRAVQLHEPKALLQLRLKREAPLASDDVMIELTPDDLTRLLDALAPVSAALEQLATD